jgi:hypothetical protein
MKPGHSGTAKGTSKPEKPREVTHDPKRGWDHVDEAGWESFPASDPPAHWAGHDRPEEPPTLNGEQEPADEEEGEEEEEEEKN